MTVTTIICFRENCELWELRAEKFIEYTKLSWLFCGYLEDENIEINADNGDLPSESLESTLRILLLGCSTKVEPLLCKNNRCRG